MSDSILPSAKSFLLGDEVTYAECPPGLFAYNGNLCFKSEYGNNEGVIDGYIVSSGEFFCGPTSNALERRKLMVRPIEIADSLSERTNMPELGWLVENGDRTMYRTIEQGIPVWTADVNKAIRFARRVDAEMFCAEDEDAWHVAEHQWG